MASSNNLILNLLITARDEASGVFGKLFGFLNDSTNVIGSKIRAGFSDLFGGGLESAAAFEEQLSKVIAKGDETYKNTEQLRKGVQEVAAQFGITGTEAAQGMEVLSAAGLNATDALKALPAVLQIAKIEGISLDAAATKLSDSLSIMGEEFSAAGKMADVLSKGANITTSSVSSLSEALSVSGGIAKSFGLDLETTVSALDLLHKNGIKGSAAGTALSAILTQLIDPTSAASVELNQLGITTRDLGGVLDGLNAAGARSGPAILAFGETAGPGLRALIHEGSAGLNDFTKQLRDSTGAAQDAADQLSANFNSALKGLASAWDGVKVSLATPLLKPLTEGLLTAKGVISDTAGLLGGALAAGAVAAAAAFVRLGPVIAESVTAFRASIAAMTAAEIATVGFSRGLALLAGPAGLILAAVSGFLLFRKGAEAAKPPVDALNDSTEQYTVALKKLGEAQLQVAKVDLEAALAKQQKIIADLNQQVIETTQRVGQQVIVWDDWAKGAHYVTVTQQDVVKQQAALEAAMQASAGLQEKYNALLGEQAQRSSTAATATEQHAQNIPALQAAVAAAAVQMQTYNDALKESGVSAEVAKAYQQELATATQDHAAAVAALRAATEPAAAAQQAYAKAVEQAKATLAPYQALVQQLRDQLNQQSQAHQDTAVTTEKLKQALSLLATQTNVYYQALSRTQQSESERPGLLAKLADAYQQQAREVARLTLAQDGSQEKTKSLEEATALLAKRSNEYTNAAQIETDAVERHGEKLASEQSVTVAATQAKLAQQQAVLALAHARGDENQAAQATSDIAAIEVQQTRQLVTEKQQLVQQAEMLLGKKQQEYALTVQNNPQQQQEIALLKDAVLQKREEAKAAEASVAVKEREAQQAQIMAGPIGQLTRLYEEQAAQHKISADASERYHDIQVKEAEGELRLAQIKGDALEIAQAEHKVIEERIDQAQALANARAQEAKDIENSVSAKVMAMAADGEWSEKDQAMENQLRATATAARDSAVEAQQHADQVREEAKASEDAAKAQKELAEATAAATEKAAQLKAQGAGVSGMLTGWVERLNALSPAARAAFDGFTEGADIASASVSELTERAGELRDELATTVEAGGNGWVRWANQTAIKAIEIEQAFISQKTAVQQSVDALNAYTDGGRLTTEAQQALALKTDEVRNRFSLLNDEDLSELRQAIDDATARMDELRQASEDALSAAQQALLEEQGNKVGVLQLQQKEKELELQQQIDEAQASGDATALANLKQALKDWEAVYALKIKAAQADAAAASSSSATPSTTISNSSSSGSKGTYNLNVNVAGKTYSLQTISDPFSLVNALEIAQRSAL